MKKILEATTTLDVRSSKQQIDNDSLTFVFEWCVVDSYSVAMVDHLSGYILPAGVNLS